MKIDFKQETGTRDEIPLITWQILDKANKQNLDFNQDENHHSFCVVTTFEKTIFNDLEIITVPMQQVKCFTIQEINYGEIIVRFCSIKSTPLGK